MGEGLPAGLRGKLWFSIASATPRGRAKPPLGRRRYLSRVGVAGIRSKPVQVILGPILGLGYIGTLRAIAIPIPERFSPLLRLDITCRQFLARFVLSEGDEGDEGGHL